jgi:hypothetical protein
VSRSLSEAKPFEISKWPPPVRAVAPPWPPVGPAEPVGAPLRYQAVEKLVNRLRARTGIEFSCHTLVHWVEDGQAQDHHYELAWLRAEDVHRFLKT